MDKTAITKEIIKYISGESLTDINSLKDDTLIFENGLLDSMGLLFLIEFLKDKYGMEVTDEELNPENFESVNRIVSFIESKSVKHIILYVRDCRLFRKY